MKRVQAVIRPERLDAVQHRLAEAGFVGVMVYDVRGHGSDDQATAGEYRGVAFSMSVKHKLLVDVLLEDDEVSSAVAAIQAGGASGKPGDGLIFVADVAAIFPVDPRT
jgi:nitrogen regulatory protein P-II 1